MHAMQHLKNTWRILFQGHTFHEAKIDPINMGQWTLLNEPQIKKKSALLALTYLFLTFFCFLVALCRLVVFACFIFLVLLDFVVFV